MATEEKRVEFAIIGDMKILHPKLPGSAPPFRSKADNFQRQMCKEEIEALWGPICRYHTSKEKFESVKEGLSDYQDIKDAELIYNKKSSSSVYKVKTKDNQDEKIIKVYHLSKKSAKDHSIELREIVRGYNLMYHTNLGEIFRLCIDRKTNDVYMAMEPLQKTLKEYVKEKHGSSGDGINELQCKSIIVDILDNLWTLHLAACVHCDLKPENIMLRDVPYKPEFNGWKLIDFDNRLFMGLNKYRLLPTALGSFGWMPPEINALIDNQIFKGKGNYFSYGYDIWALGLIILYILFGTQPYDPSGWIMTERRWYKIELLRGGKYDMNSDKNKGEIWLRNYLLDLYVNDKISKELFDLLHNHMLIFDPRKRSNCKIIYNHVWFDEIRE